MEDKEQGFFFRPVFFFNIFLGVVQDDGFEFYITGLVNTMYISERCCHGKTVANLPELFVGISNIFGLGIQL